MTDQARRDRPPPLPVVGDGIVPGTLAADVGLSDSEVRQRRQQGRVNVSSRQPTRTYVQIVRANVLTRFNALLGAMLVLIVVVGPAQDGLFGLVIVVNSAIGIVQEVRAKRTLDRLLVVTAPQATVVRDGCVQEVAVEDVVEDDLVEIRAGGQVVVDGTVVASVGLEIDESLLTGEAERILKSPGDQVLSGSFAVAGSGRYRAVSVGEAAYAAGLARQARGFVLTRSELRAGINRILGYVSWTIVPTAALLFWTQLRAEPSWPRAVSGAVAGTVAMVPEGLVLLLSIALAVAVMRLARRRVLVAELAAVEVLARVDLVCIDKTGTLTDGTMRVEGVTVLDDDATQVDAALTALARHDPAPNATMKAIARRWPPSTGASGVPVPEDDLDAWRPDRVVPFSSARKWSAMTFPGRGAWVLGAPDVLATRLRAEPPLPAPTRRTLLLASAAGVDREQLPTELRPRALLTFAERLRPEAARTVRYFAAQGMEVMVLSGDNPQTLAVAAGALGLPGAGDPIDARTLPADEHALGEAIGARRVIGRVAPDQKASIVRAMQAGGHTVAMIGDGVNDALAVKQADLGIAMGTGSDAARSVAQMVLLDSDFATLPDVVAEGRRVLGNIERTSSLYLTKTVYAMVLSLAIGVIGLVFPFLPRHLTLVGTLTIGIPSFVLALAPNAQPFRPGFVARTLRFCLPAGMLAATAVLLAYHLARHEPGLSIAQQRTTAAMTLLWVGLAVVSLVGAPLSRPRAMMLGGLAGGFVLALLIPFVRAFFALQAPPLIVWLAAIGIAALVWSTARLFLPDDGRTAVQTVEVPAVTPGPADVRLAEPLPPASPGGQPHRADGNRPRPARSGAGRHPTLGEGGHVNAPRLDRGEL
jgi:magnesium-transporting ATPase (P-type)